MYRHVLDTLALPRPGRLVLVAGGLLGKVCCDRVRPLDGAALEGAYKIGQIGISGAQTYDPGEVDPRKP